MAGAVTCAIGLVVAIFPDLWLALFTRDPAALEAGRLYFRIVGPDASSWRPGWLVGWSALSIETSPGAHL